MVVVQPCFVDYSIVVFEITKCFIHYSRVVSEILESMFFNRSLGHEMFEFSWPLHEKLTWHTLLQSTF